MTFRDKTIDLRIVVAVSLLLFAVAGCEKTPTGNDTNGKGYIQVAVSSYSSGINLDNESWEDRVDELRMIMFDSRNGTVVFNEKLYFPNGFSGRCRPVRVLPGTYDFCFIANEGAYGGSFADALMEVDNKTGLGTDPRFMTLAYNPDFVPDGTTPTGRFVMSAMYTGITLTGGGTQATPELLPLPTGKIMLVRSQAKVEVVFRKKVSGATIPQAEEINSVRLDNVAATLSIPPYDDYYVGNTQSSKQASTAGFRYDQDIIGSVTFYIPEFLVSDNSPEYTGLNINNEVFPIMVVDGFSGLAAQLRSVPELGVNSVVRNYHYYINAYLNVEGNIEIETQVKPWRNAGYTYMFEGDLSLVIPPVFPTDSSLVIDSDCGRIELLSATEDLHNGLLGAYNDVIDWNNQSIIEGRSPYYCEQKYGEGWRLINSCELMSFLSALDAAYRVWTSNTWNANGYTPVFPMDFRKAAQTVLEKLTALDLSDATYSEDFMGDNLGANSNLPGFMYTYFVPGDIMVRESDFPNGSWPYPGQSAASAPWIYNEATIQLLAFWDSKYFTLTNRDNWDRALHSNFFEYTYSSTRSRCVRNVD